MIAVLLVALGAAPPTPPCKHGKGDTTGWRTERFNERLAFSLPPTFSRDRTVMYTDTPGRRWTDGSNIFEVLGGYFESFAKNNPKAESYSECVDTLAQRRFRIITWHWKAEHRYYAVAVDEAAYSAKPVPGGDHPWTLTGQSSDSAGQDLFLAIFHTLRVDSTDALLYGTWRWIWTSPGRLSSVGGNLITREECRCERHLTLLPGGDYFLVERDSIRETSAWGVFTIHRSTRFVSSWIDLDKGLRVDSSHGLQREWLFWFYGRDTLHLSQGDSGAAVVDAGPERYVRER